MLRGFEGKRPAGKPKQISKGIYLIRSMDKWLGNGGMPLLEEFGVELTEYGEGWVEGTWNPNGPVQGGISAAVADAVMAFATFAALERGERCTLIEMKLSYLLGIVKGDKLRIRGEVVRLTRKIAFCRAIIFRADGEVAVEATGTNLLMLENHT